MLCGTHYSFSYHAPSLLAASAILAALYSLSSDADFVELVGRELKLRVQTVTHTATVSLANLQENEALNEFIMSGLHSRRAKAVKVTNDFWEVGELNFV